MALALTTEATPPVRLRYGLSVLEERAEGGVAGPLASSVCLRFLGVEGTSTLIGVEKKRSAMIVVMVRHRESSPVVVTQIEGRTERTIGRTRQVTVGEHM